MSLFDTQTLNLESIPAPLLNAGSYGPQHAHTLVWEQAGGCLPAQHERVRLLPHHVRYVCHLHISLMCGSCIEAGLAISHMACCLKWRWCAGNPQIEFESTGHMLLNEPACCLTTSGMSATCTMPRSIMPVDPSLMSAAPRPQAWRAQACNCSSASLQHLLAVRQHLARLMPLPLPLPLSLPLPAWELTRPLTPSCQTATASQSLTLELPAIKRSTGGIA